MKRLLALLLVMGGCSSNTTDITVPNTVAVKSPAVVHIEDVKTVDSAQTEERNDLLYLINSETPFTGIVVGKYQNGQKEWESNYKNGKEDGKATNWYESGQKEIEGAHKNGKAEGPHTQWHDNGQKEAEGAYKDGKLEGKWTLWYPNGKKEAEETYKNGKPDGPYIDWYDNGQKRREGTSKGGKPLTGKHWDEEGNEIKE